MEFNRYDNNNDNSSTQLQSSTPVQPTADTPMKWHKFLIYFSLWASAVMNVLNSFVMFTGAHYGGENEARMVYNFFDGLKSVDIIMGVLFIGIAIFAIVTRFSLAKYQSKGPKQLLAVYGLNAVLTVAYPLLASAVTGMELSELMDSSTISSIVSSVVMILINKTYYDKRAHLFVN